MGGGGGHWAAARGWWPVGGGGGLGIMLGPYHALPRHASATVDLLWDSPVMHTEWIAPADVLFFPVGLGWVGLGQSNCIPF